MRMRGNGFKVLIWLFLGLFVGSLFLLGCLFRELRHEEVSLKRPKQAEIEKRREKAKLEKRQKEAERRESEKRRLPEVKVEYAGFRKVLKGAF